MKFATRTNLGLNRPPAIWFIRRFLDPEAEIHFFATELVLAEAARIGAIPFHIAGAELHVDKERKRTTLDALMEKFEWKGRDPALDLVADLVNDATYGVPSGAPRHPESVGLRAIDQGLRATAPGDAERLVATKVIYDALYEWARKRLGGGS